MRTKSEPWFVVLSLSALAPCPSLCLSSSASPKPSPWLLSAYFLAMQPAVAFSLRVIHPCQTPRHLPLSYHSSRLTACQIHVAEQPYVRAVCLGGLEYRQSKTLQQYHHQVQA